MESVSGRDWKEIEKGLERVGKGLERVGKRIEKG